MTQMTRIFIFICKINNPRHLRHPRLKNVRSAISLSLEEEPQDIVEVRPQQQPEQEEHAHHLRTFHELVAGLAACNDFVNEE